MLSKLRYRFFTGQGESKSLTDVRQEMLGCGDRGAGWVPAGKMEQLVTGTSKVSWGTSWLVGKQVRKY